MVSPRKISTPLAVIVAVAACSSLLVSTPAAAQEGGESESVAPPLDLLFDEGVSSDHPLLRPGKLDFLYRRRPERNEYNFIAWSPVFKGGLGTLDFDSAGTLSYFGGYLRPLAPWPEAGELILGGLAVDPEEDTAYEVQAEYRLPFGLGGGGGVVERTESDLDVSFGKLTYRDTVGSAWNYIVEVQGQDVSGEVSPGGYVAVYNDLLMAVGGYDGEEWRATLGFVAPESEGILRPAAEVLYVDGSVGDQEGAKFLFVNATLKYGGGFLSHAARLGRAMGPQGLEYGNPLGFLRPTWNRRLDVWELGGLADYRLVRTELAGGAVDEKHQVLIYPLQIDDLDALFVGGTYTRRSQGDETPGVLTGLSGKVAFLKASVAFEYETETDDWTLTIGIIDAF